MLRSNARRVLANPLPRPVSRVKVVLSQHALPLDALGDKKGKKEFFGYNNTQNKPFPSTRNREKKLLFFRGAVGGPSNTSKTKKPDSVQPSPSTSKFKGRPRCNIRELLTQPPSKPKRTPPPTPQSKLLDGQRKKETREYVAHRETLKKLYPEGWNPPKKLSREAMDGIRAIYAHDPAKFDTALLAQEFRVSPEAVRRVLKGKWVPTPERRAKLLQAEMKKRMERVKKRYLKERGELVALRAGKE